jgi:ABC-type polysaccharide/polyol phosphate transport system ATPase subunit
MYMRLAFSTAIYCEPEILLIDEVFAVGDTAFQKKCTAKINEFRIQGKTIIFITHSMEALKEICSQAMLLNNGTAISIGSPSKIATEYLSLLNIKIQ